MQKTKERHRFDSWVRKIPWRRAQQPTPIFLPRESMNREAWWAIVHGGHKESNMTEERLSTNAHIPMYLKVKF